VLWSELSKHHQRCLLKDLFEWTSIRFNFKEHPQGWFGIARSATHSENMQGFHSENMLILVDEASGVDDEIMEVLEGAASQEGNIIMYFGNPTRLNGAFYDSFNTKKEFFTTMTMSCLESTNVSPKYAKGIAAKYGEDSDVYRVRVLGEFPQSEEDSLIPLIDVQQASRKEIITDDNEPEEYGIDVARYGNDETTIYKRKGLKITEEWISQKNSTMEIVAKIMQLIKDKTCKITINIDDSGVGGGVTDRLKELQYSGDINKRVIINPINNGSRAIDKKQYKNRISELWFYMKEYIKECSIPQDNELIQQLSSRKYVFFSDGRLMVEPKDKMKERGLSSPDRADGVLLTLVSMVKYAPLVAVREKDTNPTTRQLEEPDIQW